MLNTSILFLSLSSLSRSPYIITPFKKEIPTFTVEKSIFQQFSTSFLQTFTTMHKTVIENTQFMHFINTPLIFQDDLPKDHCFVGKNNVYKDNQILKGWDFFSGKDEFLAYNDRPFFINNCGDIRLKGCTFKDLQNDENANAKSGGGALLITQECNVIIYDCLFSICRTNDHGGAIFICKKKVSSMNDGDKGFNDEELIHLDVKYCCFQDCFQWTGNKYGVAMYAAAKSTNLSYITTVRCPAHAIEGIGGSVNPNSRKSEGPQFDIQASVRIDSCNINTTGGNSIYCAGIEYRKSKNGFFRFQTVIGMVGKFATSFTSLSQDFTINYCNYIDNTVRLEDVNDYDDASLIHIRDKSATFSHFYIKNTKYEVVNGNNLNKCKIFSKNNGHTGTVTVKDSYIAENDKEKFWGIDLQNCHTNYDFQTITISQLMKGDCMGVLTAEPAIISPTFTASKTFTLSDEFTKSELFTQSTSFSESDFFTKSTQFSTSFFFTQSTKFTKSEPFSQTTRFSESGLFTQSTYFSKSDFFTKSTQFSTSFFFTQSTKFTKSEPFSLTTRFSKSELFTQSTSFSKSDFFTKSTQFSTSFFFTQSTKFTKSELFSQTTDFTQSQKFSQSDFFTSSKPFTQSLNFDHTSFFTPSNVFTPSDYFSQSDGFTSSFYFSSTNQFSKSSEFSNSDKFSDSDYAKLYFNKTSEFTQSDHIINIYIRDASNEGNAALSTGKITGIAVSSAALAALIVFAVLYIYKKKNYIEFDDAEVRQEGSVEDIHYENPLFGVTADDPFAQDFDEIQVEEYVL